MRSWLAAVLRTTADHLETPKPMVTNVSINAPVDAVGVDEAMRRVAAAQVHQSLTFSRR